ncbi:AMMONIUM TRANSPORTER MEP2 [Salix purpurea]|uniref:AMMONIUM TRANSPORTER MEP2 n=1 Tax=Salix purpurea TaxID=77065 RepID=A0A9Q0ZRR7_SALPP|nr:AMMONIUM TRANSPORTER MEP2 [Salix purpurea]
MVWFQCVFAAITLILLARRMNFKAWMAFVPLLLTFSYTVGAFSLWGVVVYSGGYVIHLFVVFPWREERIFLKVDGEKFLKMMQVGPRSFPSNNALLTLAGAGLQWMGGAGFNGGDPYTANIDSSMAVLNRNICAATSLLVWT